MNTIQILQSTPTLRIMLSGEWLYTTSKKDLRALQKTLQKAQHIEIDFSTQPIVDFVFCVYLLSLLEHKTYTFTHLNHHSKEIFATINHSITLHKYKH